MDAMLGALVLPDGVSSPPPACAQQPWLWPEATRLGQLPACLWGLGTVPSGAILRQAALVLIKLGCFLHLALLAERLSWQGVDTPALGERGDPATSQRMGSPNL